MTLLSWWLNTSGFISFIQEIAASLLSVISFPAFAVEDKELVDTTRDEIIDELQVLAFPLKFIMFSLFDMSLFRGNMAYADFYGTDTKHQLR